MSTITLSYSVVGKNPYENAFNIKINKTEAVSKLRKAIKKELYPKFENVSLMTLTYGRSTFLSKKKTKNYSLSTQK